MSSTKDLLRIYSKYNVWAYRRLLVAVEQLSDQAYHSNTGLAFRSIHGTLNHLYLGDQLWIKRFKNDTNGIASISSFWTEAEVYSKPGDAECYWEKYITDRKVLAASILTQAKEYDEFIAALDASTDFSDTFSHHDSHGILRQRPLGKTLLHVVNHATHHRGQISAAVTALGGRPPIMDLAYFDESQE